LDIHVVLNAKRETQKHDQEQYQARAKAIEDLQRPHNGLRENSSWMVVGIRLFLY
jgi:hypothetical protein